MKTKLLLLVAAVGLAAPGQAQVEPRAGTWKTWFIPSGKAYRLPPPPSYKGELSPVLAQQQTLNTATRQHITYWNAGSPGYRWQNLMGTLWMNGTSNQGALANMLLGVATYDATLAAWDTKYAYGRPRPFAVDKRITGYGPKPDSPSYPCEHSVAAGVAVTVIAHFFPAMADSVQRLARQLMASRIAAGVAFPSDTRAGFELGKRIAEREIEHTKTFAHQGAWDGKRPQGQGYWQGKTPLFPLAGLNKTVVLDSSSQFRPGPPPDFAHDMAELKTFKPTFRSQANAFLFASQPVWEELLHKKIFEYNLHLNPPRAARLYALTAIGVYDGFTACWDAKFTYWGIRPDEYDPSFRPALLVTPPFPGYPSGHAAISGVMGELYAAFFPAESASFRKKANDGAESRFQGGIHFRTDNEVGLQLGRNVAALIVQKAKLDGSDEAVTLAARKKTGPNPKK